jgi:hypothetical protein
MCLFGPLKNIGLTIRRRNDNVLQDDDVATKLNDAERALFARMKRGRRTVRPINQDCLTNMKILENSWIAGSGFCKSLFLQVMEMIENVLLKNHRPMSKIP